MENKINYKTIQNYIDLLIPSSSLFLEELFLTAQKEHIPVITRETRRFLEVLLSLCKPQRILEIGTAVGYSAIVFATVLPQAQITTIEVEEALAERARENIKKAGVSHQIQVIHDDARNVLPYLTTPFDFVFLDAAKGQYTEYDPFVKKLLRPGGVLLSDNVLFKGLVAETHPVQKNKRSLVEDLTNYNRGLMADKGYLTTLLPVGDGLALSYKKMEEQE